MTDKELSEAARALGRKGGLSKSDRKRTSSAANGKLSHGRPPVYDWYITVKTDLDEQTFIFPNKIARADFIRQIRQAGNKSVTWTTSRQKKEDTK